MNPSMKLQISHRDGYARIGSFSTDNITFQIPNFLQIEKIQADNQSTAPMNKSLPDSPLKQPILHMGKSVFFTQSQELFSDFSVEKFISLPPDLPLKSYQLAETLVSQNTSITVIPPDVEYIQHKKFDKNLSLVIVPYAPQLLSRQTYCSKVLSVLRDRLSPHILIYLPSVATPANLALLTYLGIDVFDLNKAAFAAIQEIFLFREGAYHKSSFESNPCLCPICLSKDIDKLTVSDINTHNAYVLFS